MSVLSKKIDFVAYFSVTRANPNGDPINGNLPRLDYDGYGEVSAECIKRKIRNRLQDAGEKILIQMEERTDDEYTCIRDRINGNAEVVKALGKKGATKEVIARACASWIDVRSFGQLFALKRGDSANGVSIGIRGPVSIHPAVSVDPVSITTSKITKSTNTEPSDKKGSDTMGDRHRVDFGVYKVMGSINVQLAECTGFSDADADKIKEAILTLFENDASSARPEGSMEMRRVYWVTHSCKIGDAPTAQVHRGVQAYLRDGVDMPRVWEDYVFDDERLMGMKAKGIVVEKYVDATLVS